MIRAFHLPIVFAWATLALVPVCRADEVPPACPDSDPKSKSRPLFDSGALMPYLLALEAQGEAAFRPTYETPPGECLRESFEVAGTAVSARYVPFQKGEKTLNYRYVAGDGAARRDVVVIYDAMASLMAKKNVFFVIEDRAGAISVYAMFRDPPTHAALKPIVTGIVDGSAKPLATVRWPKGAKEPVIEAYDSDRLK
jgi:hypothetical protein